MNSKSSVLLLSVLCGVHGYQHYQKSIPNGDKVLHPHPHTPAIWSGVGHENRQGGGARNTFGNDFSDNGHVWNKALCMKDSDGDGRTNGEELGDPDCVWKRGDIPKQTSGLSHPGVCETSNNVSCETVNSRVKRDNREQFDCPAATEAGVSVETLRFPPTEIPAAQTTYFCQYFPFSVPSGTAHHVVAYEPIIDNADVMRHALVYGCKSMDRHALDNLGKTSAPFECQHASSGCMNVVMMWAKGLYGMCYPDDYGILIGEGGYVGVVMELNWNNPLKRSGMTDSSGLRMYHTANLRPDNAAYVLWGPQNYKLPKGSKSVMIEGTCDNRLTDFFTSDDVTIVNMIPHMHLYGRAMTVKHSRPDEFEDRVVLAQNAFNYDHTVIFETNIEFKRGDEMTIECTYNTSAAESTVSWGMSITDEMCFIMAMVYPFDESVPVFCGIEASAGSDGIYPAVILTVTSVLLHQC